MNIQTGLLLVVGFWLVGGVACQQAGGQQAPSGWVTHKEPQGFSVQVPRGWKVRGDQVSGRVELSGTRGEQLFVWPVFTNGPLSMPSAAETLRLVAERLLPDAAWESPQPAGAAAVRLLGRSGDRVALSAFTWVTSPQGTAGYIYAIAAPEPSYRQTDETFAKVLQSFRITGSQDGRQAPKPALEYVTWVDPRENAFSVDVPKGWQVSGGIFRFSVIDVRGAVELTAPDRQIRITSGDPEIPTFAEPFSVMGITYPEGTWYNAGHRNNYFVRRYVPGTAFAREYVETKAARGCPQLTIEHARDREDAIRAINAVVAQWGALGIQARLTAGEVAFTCRGQGALHGYYFAATGLAQTQVGSWWRPNYLLGYLAASGRVADAQAAMEQMLKSFRPNPQWVQMQSNTIAKSAQIVARTNQEISNIISRTYWTTQASRERSSQSFAGAIRGVEEVTDPVTGRQVTVESGSNYYWVDNRGTIVGTETHTTPSVDFRQLVRLP